MAAGQVNITFKKTELDLAEFLESKSSKSGYIKDLIKQQMILEKQGIMQQPITVPVVTEAQKETTKKGIKTLSKFFNDDSEDE